MTPALFWAPSAVDRAAGFLRDDPDGLRDVMDRVDELAEDPIPADSTEFGFTFLRRLRVGRYRILYELDDDAASVVIVHLGRLG